MSVWKHIFQCKCLLFFLFFCIGVVLSSHYFVDHAGVYSHDTLCFLLSDSYLYFSMILSLSLHVKISFIFEKNNKIEVLFFHKLKFDSLVFVLVHVSAIKY